MTVTNGLIAQFLFEQNVNDETGNHTASFNGTPAYVTGYGSSFAGNFSGSSSWIDVASPYIGLPSEWSISTWFQLPSGIVANGNWNTLSRGSSSHHQVIIESNTGELGGYDNNGGQFRGTGHFMQQYEDGNWHHLAVTGSGTTQQFYIDNVNVGSIDRNLASDIRSIGNHWGNSQPWGYLDDFRVYNRALTVEETNTLYIGDLPEGAKATGGFVTTTEIDGNTYIVHTFTQDGVFEVLDESIEVDYLIVGGGGGGVDSAGGGAGGLLTGQTTVSSSNQYTILVGAGGSGGLNNESTAGSASNGENSSAFGLTAFGGGRGGAYSESSGADGGSGGGGSRSSSSGALGGSGTPGQGNDGGGNTNGDYAGGGGGGAGSSGGTGNGSTDVGGAGGDGLEISITGTATYYAGGGGGAARSTAGTGGLGGGGSGSNSSGNPLPTSGIPNTGGGGGGMWNNSAPNEPGAGSGGSGVVIVRYVLQRVDGLSVSSNELIFGETFSATLTVVDAVDNTEVPYTITGVSSESIDDFPLTGNFVITDEQATVSFTATPSAKETFTITANGFSETVDLAENIYGLAKLPEPNFLTFTSEALAVIDLSNVSHVLEITILNTTETATYNLGASPSVLLALRSFITIDFASVTSFNSTEALDFDPPQFWIGA